MNLNTLAIKKLMVSHKLTRAALAKAAGISRQSISTIMNRGTFSLANAGKLAEALGVELEEIAKEE